MRIAIFTESYEPIINGVSVCVSTLREGLTRRGHEVFVFAPRYEGFIDQYEGVYRLPAKHTVLMRDYPFPVPFAPKFKRIFADLKLDVVHTQTPFVLGVLGAKWARQFDVPFVSTNHTLYTEYAHYVPVRPKAFTKLFLTRLMKWYYSGCDAVVVPSKPVEDILRSYGIQTRVEVIKTGIDAVPELIPELREEVRRRYGVGPSTGSGCSEAGSDCNFLLLYVGRIAREKNLRMLLAAFKIVASTHKQAKLLFVGGGPALAETKAYASELGLGDRVEFLGMLKRHDIAPIYASADAFAFPSATETQGIAICEAMSAGLPIVAVNAGGIPENLEPGADSFLTNDDPAEFADRISYLITHDKERAEMGSRARANACSFTIESMVDDFEQLYASVIDAAPVSLSRK